MKRKVYISHATSYRWYRWAGIAIALVLSGTSVWAAPEWHKEVDKLTALFNPKVALAGMKEQLEYFRLVFTALGYGAVMISVIRKVTKARGGEESMGWVASLVMTVALMATGPAIGEEIYQACDLVAKNSGYDQADSIKTCWNALLVILPSDSPVQDVLNDAAPGKDLGKGAPVQKQDASWTKLAWTWMKMAWSTMTNALDKIGASLHAVANQILVIVLLFIPTVALLIGMVLIQLGGFLRELLHQSMDVFLPMMVAMLSFAPMRGAASNFIIKYISVAFWPVAWALGNALACSLLVSVMAWVVSVSQSTLEALYKTAGGADPTAAGYLSGAAAAMPWGLLQVIVLVISITSLLIIASAIGAPLALTATMTKGACFAGAQLRQAASTAATVASAAATGGASVALAPAASSGVGMLSSVAMRASSSMGSAAARLAPMGAGGGPAGAMASMGASFLSGASRAIGSLASGSSMMDAEGGSDSAPLALPPPRTSMMNTMMPPQQHAGLGVAASEPSQSRSTSAATIPRNYRRAAPAIES